MVGAVREERRKRFLPFKNTATKSAQIEKLVEYLTNI